MSNAKGRALKPDPLLGRMIGDRQRYRLDKCLGGGGMGVVYQAMDLSLGRTVALKLLKSDLGDHEDLRKRFEREITISAALDSEHIVQVTDHGVMDDYPFYVMELLRGQSLGDLLRQEGRLSLVRGIRIALQICAGLRVAHKGITLWREGATTAECIRVVHRDLKPDNVFLVPHEIMGEMVKLLDFGIAKIRNEQLTMTNLTSMGSFLGTCRYAAPEQWRGDEDIDGRADIYSLGFILYEMFSGTDPFGLHSDIRGVNPTSWLTAHAFTEPTPLRQLSSCQSLPPLLDQIILRCLQKDPADRYATVEDLSLDLQALLDQDIISPQSLDPTQVDRRQATTPAPGSPKNGAPERVNKPSSTPASINRVPSVGSPSTHQITRADRTQATTPSPRKPSFKSETQPLPASGGTAVNVQPAKAGNNSATSTTVEPSAEVKHSPPPQQGQKSPPWQRWSLVVAGTLLVAGLGGTFWLMRPSSQLQEARSHAGQGDLLSAITTGQRVPKTSPDYEAAQALVSQWQLELALGAAATGDLITAITRGQEITREQPAYETVQPLLAEWIFKQATNDIQSQDFSRAKAFLTQVPENQPMTPQASELATALSQLEQAQSQSSEGSFQDAIATTYAIDPNGLLGAAAEQVMCESLAALLDRDFRNNVDLPAEPGKLPPLFENYRLSDCTSPTLTIGTDMIRLEDRGDNNLKLNALVMGGFVWTQLPEPARIRLGQGEIHVEFFEQDQMVFRVVITQPAQIGAGAEQLEAMLASMRIQRT
ncbi:MAG: protein kinase [Synechococcaceae cyanobacterium SM2_3_1]|nr:protein kinase [Synechococcaceae cyanobacterium SM2_3_1]